MSVVQHPEAKAAVMAMALGAMSNGMELLELAECIHTRTVQLPSMPDRPDNLEFLIDQAIERIGFAPLVRFLLDKMPVTSWAEYQISRDGIYHLLLAVSAEHEKQHEWLQRQLSYIHARIDSVAGATSRLQDSYLHHSHHVPSA